MNTGSLSLSERVNFMNNQGSLYVFNTQIEFKGIVSFMNNFGDYGGAITAFLSEISFNTASTITIFNNTATNGGGISLIQSNMHVYHSIELTENHATDFGGGIYAYQSDIDFKQRSDVTKNTASNGGAICAVASNIHISNSNMEFNSNIAKVNGGAIYLEQNSKIYLRKYEQEDQDTELKVRLDFTSNYAEKGGAIFIADNTNDEVICQGANIEIYQAECFLQTLELYQNDVYSSVFYYNYINTFFSNNTARQSGSDIYGGLLDRCTINQNAELVHYFPELRNSSGFDYVKATTQIEQIIDYYPIQCSSFCPGHFIESISRSDVKELISSDAVRVEFCLDNVISSNYSHPNVSIKKGEMFTVSVVAVDQVGNPLNATIINSFQSKSGNGRLKAGQVEQQVGDQCTELEFNVYSQDNSAQIHIHADGPCGDKGVSRKTLNVMFLPCICSIGFHPSQSENDCICECDQNSLVFCSDNLLSPNNSYTNVSKKKGEMFTISVVAVDQTGNPINTTIISSFSSESAKGHIKDSQVIQQVENQCTEVEYNVYSLDNSAKIHINLYTDTPCGNRVATRTLNVIFLPCTCRAGFHPSPSENDCICECDQNSLVFCSDNVLSPNNSYTNVSKKKGEMFTISVVAVDQTGNPINATIISSFSSESGKGHIKDSQVVQQVKNQCTEVEYNVYSLDNSAKIHINLYTDTPCGNRVATRTLNVIFLPCTCPAGFHPSPSENDCICECDQNSLVFCSDNVLSPNNSYTNVSKKKGEMFTISVVAVDQTGTPINTTIISSFSSESGKGHIKDSQVVQQVEDQCTEVEYNVYSLDNSAKIHINLYTDTPCGNRVATSTLNVIFLPCTCPAGFHPSPSENDCICECGQSSLVFCLDNVLSPNYSYHNISIKKGEMFTLSIVAVDHDWNAVNSTTISSFSSESRKGHLKDSQVVQQVGNQCTELKYNVYSLDNSAQIHINLYTDTLCGNRISTKTLNLNFLPCICPVGFQVSQSENDCICECDQRLKQHQITTCSAENETILVENNLWIGFGDYTNETELYIHTCPFDYCVQEPVHVNLSSTDEQCAYNRTGNLCGMCQENRSLVFGSSRCQECSDNYISILIPFALAGIALVAFILLLNLTVATGTINGLIFYANILTANHSLLLPLSTSNFLTVFISWLNLDLGIETCFYDGMNSYGKFLLQLAFPTYVFVLIGTIIVLCEVSKKFATLLSNRNPVAALCTLILLSYSKLIRTIITALQFTHLDYPDGSSEIVWLYDANVPYFTVSHIPRFIAAFFIIILGVVYTILLLFGQWFPRCSNRKIMKWSKNTKYNAFIDAYHAPFTPKHRYWFGLLLFAQITHNLVAAMTPDSLIAILSAGCIALGLLIPGYTRKVYKIHWKQSS